MTEAVKKEEVPHLVFAVTLAYFGVTFLLTRMARSVLVQWTSKEVHPFANDILSTFQVIACSLENRSTKQTYGDLAFTFQLFVVGMLHSFTLTGCGNPCGNMVRMLTRKDSLAVGCLKMALQLLGGVMAWFYAKRIWSLGLSELHAQRYVEKECLTDLNTDVGSGCLLEFGAALCLLVISRDGRLPLVVQMALDSLITVSETHILRFVDASMYLPNTTPMYSSPEIRELGHPRGGDRRVGWTFCLHNSPERLQLGTRVPLTPDFVLLYTTLLLPLKIKRRSKRALFAVLY